MKAVQKEPERLWMKGFVKETLSLEWKAERVIGGAKVVSPVTVIRWYVQDEVNQEESELNRIRVTERRSELIPQERWCISKSKVGDL